MPSLLELFLDEAVAAVGPKLSDIGFSTAPKHIKTFEHHFLEWYREDAWKRETIGISFKPRSTLFDLGNEVALLVDQGELVRLDSQSVDSTPRGGSYRMPESKGLVSRWRRAWLKVRVCKDCMRGLPWFDQFQSPETALVRLRTGETNGCGGGGKNYDRAERFLEALIDGQG